MSGFQRYAIYYVPDETSLAEFGANWLGWDISTGKTVERHPDAPDPEIVATPRKYGFHSTLKPPFQLALGRHVDDLAADLSSFCGRTAPVNMGGLRLSRIGHFLALIPDGDTKDLNELAFSVVRTFDPYRRPAEEAELQRRRSAGLSEAQEKNLLTWGYPYVGQEFRFHLTLTGKLDPQALAETVRVLEDRLPELPPRFDMTSIALVGEDASGQFRMIHRYALTG